MTGPVLALLIVAAAPLPAPDCSAVPGWAQRGPSRRYDAETLFDYMDGNSEGYFAYGFTLMLGVTCVNAASDELVIDVSQMGDSDRAWGFFTANRDVRSPVAAIGSAGQLLARRATLREGQPLRRDRGEPRQGPRRGAAGLRRGARACAPRREPSPGSRQLVSRGRPRARLGPARPAERPRAATAGERMDRPVRDGPRLRLARGLGGRSRGDARQAARPLPRRGAGGRTRRRGLLGPRRLPRRGADLPQGNERGRRGERRRGPGPEAARDGARRPAALRGRPARPACRDCRAAAFEARAPQAKSACARATRRATSTPSGQRTAQLAQSEQRTSRCAFGRLRKCSRPRPNWP